jgi:Putative undecaprenyl diphosphate synthase
MRTASRVSPPQLKCEPATVVQPEQIWAGFAVFAHRRRHERKLSTVCKVLCRTEEASAGNDAVQVAVALSYGGRQDIVQAARAIAEAAMAGSIKPSDVSASMIQDMLQSSSACKSGPPDLLIRCVTLPPGVSVAERAPAYDGMCAFPCAHGTRALSCAGRVVSSG